MALRLLACLAVAFTVQTAGVEPPRPALAPEIVKRLDRDYPGWRIAPPEDEGRDRAFAADTNVARGDFDGNGSVDLAVVIVYPTPGPNPLHAHSMRAVAFLRGAQPIPLIDPEPALDGHDVSLSLIEKGSEGYDMNTNKTFRFERDAILLTREGACTSFMFRSGRFEGLWTCD